MIVFESYIWIFGLFSLLYQVYEYGRDVFCQIFLILNPKLKNTRHFVEQHFMITLKIFSNLEGLSVLLNDSVTRATEIIFGCP